jgi:mRNA interferase RelE/StbE
LLKLIGADQLWRVRSGDYRIVYEIQDARLIVFVVHFGHRRVVYRGRK